MRPQLYENYLRLQAPLPQLPIGKVSEVPKTPQTFIMEENLKIDWPAFIKWFNRTLKQCNSAIREIRVISNGKKSQCQRIVNQLGSKQLFIEAIITMMTNDFCNGRKKTEKSPQGWLASFPWLLGNDENVANLLNGVFDNLPEQPPTPEEQKQLERKEEARRQEEQRQKARAIEEQEREERRQRRQREEAEIEALRRQGKTPFMLYYEDLQRRAAAGDANAAEMVLQHEAAYKEHCRMVKQGK